MRKGYQNLLETLRLLTATESEKSIEWISLQTASGREYKCAMVRLDGTELYGKIWGEHAWVQIPTDELVGLAVELGAMAEGRELPAILTDARKRVKAARVVAAA